MIRACLRVAASWTVRQLKQPQRCLVGATALVLGAPSDVARAGINPVGVSSSLAIVLARPRMRLAGTGGSGPALALACALDAMEALPASCDVEVDMETGAFLERARQGATRPAHVADAGEWNDLVARARSAGRRFPRLRTLGPELVALSRQQRAMALSHARYVAEAHARTFAPPAHAAMRARTDIQSHAASAAVEPRPSADIEIVVDGSAAGPQSNWIAGAAIHAAPWLSLPGQGPRALVGSMVASPAFARDAECYALALGAELALRIVEERGASPRPSIAIVGDNIESCEAARRFLAGLSQRDGHGINADVLRILSQSLRAAAEAGASVVVRWKYDDDAWHRLTGHAHRVAHQKALNRLRAVRFDTTGRRDGAQ
ncbi:MAG: hypothetical protein IBJ15_04960 [Alphaproteobacteria bacterium]|nr:hypothetical protein [Alphaproteobacteria bacterium]